MTKKDQSSRSLFLIFSCSTDLMVSHQVPPGLVVFSCRILAISPSSAPFFSGLGQKHSQALGFFPPFHPQHNLFPLRPNEKRDSSPQQKTFSTIIHWFAPISRQAAGTIPEQLLQSLNGNKFPLFLFSYHFSSSLFGCLQDLRSRDTTMALGRLDVISGAFAGL